MCYVKVLGPFDRPNFSSIHELFSKTLGRHFYYSRTSALSSGFSFSCRHDEVFLLCFAKFVSSSPRLLHNHVHRRSRPLLPSPKQDLPSTPFRMGSDNGEKNRLGAPLSAAPGLPPVGPAVHKKPWFLLTQFFINIVPFLACLGIALTIFHYSSAAESYRRNIAYVTHLFTGAAIVVEQPPPLSSTLLTSNLLVLIQHFSTLPQSEWNVALFYLSLVIVGRTVTFANVFAMTYKQRVFGTASANVRANMYLYRTMGGAPGDSSTTRTPATTANGTSRSSDDQYEIVEDSCTGAQTCVLIEEGLAGKYNRANRSLHHMVENISGFLLVLLPASLVFPFPSFVCVCVWAAGRLLHQVSYAVGGYGPHSIGFSFSMMAATVLEAFCLLVVGCKLRLIG